MLKSIRHMDYVVLLCKDLTVMKDFYNKTMGFPIYLDAGFDQCEKTILFLYEDYLVTLPSSIDLKDPKTTLQEYLQSRKVDLPVYKVTKTEGKSHDQIFTIECSVTGLDIVATGKGSSRKKAEQMAAAEALKQAQNGK